MNTLSYSGFQNIINRNIRFHNLKHSDPDPFRSFKSSSHHKSHSLTIGQFILGKTIGKGTFGKVKLGTHMLTGEKAAVKILEKVKLLDETDKSRISREIKILKATFHHNIIRVYSVIETKKQIYLITEYAEGGELFNYIVQKRKLNEFEACKFFHQLIDAVDYIHKLGICHRDLKPENMLLDHKRNLKIADFGLSNLYSKGDLLSTACGSPGYAAPEMILGERYNGLLTDIWSCGIILFVMLCGYLPFDDQDENVLYGKIIIGKYIMPSGLSVIAKDMISRILVTDPNRRMIIDQIRSHPWYSLYKMDRIKGLFISIQSIPIDKKIVKDMKMYGYDEEELKHMLISNKHNNATTLYYMLIKKNMKKGIGSISDLISKQFIQYINQSCSKMEPEYLILTRVNSSINIENTACTVNKTMSHKSRYIFYQDQNEEDLTITNIINNNDDDINGCNLENISERNEKIETFGNNEPKITRFKGLKRLKKFKIIKNEIPLMTQLKSQYDKYMTNSYVRKQQTPQFAKGFLKTSMSFHMNEQKNIKSNNHTSTIDNNISTTPSNNNSKSPTPKNKNVYLKKRLTMFTNANKPNSKGKGKRCFSQPKKYYERIKQHISTNPKSTDNSSNGQNSFRQNIFFPNKSNSIHNKYMIIKKYRAIHCKTPTFTNKNKINKNKYNRSNIFAQRTPYKKYNMNYRNKSMKDKKGVKSIFYSWQNKSDSNSSNNKTVMTNHKSNNNKILSYRNMFLYKKIPFHKKIEHKRPISEPKKQMHLYQHKYLQHKLKDTNTISTRKRVHSRTIAIVLAQKKCKTILNYNKLNHNRVQSPNKIPIGCNKRNNGASCEKKTINIHKLVQKKQGFNYARKAPEINLSTVKNKLLNGNNHIVNTKKQQNNNYRSKSTCSTPYKQHRNRNGNNNNTIINNKRNWIFSFNINRAKDLIQLLLATEKINVAPIINTNNKYLCEKDSISLMLELITENKKEVRINISKIKGEDRKYALIKNNIYHLLKT